MPLLEHLIARGEVRDPSPLERPLRRLDAVNALRASESPLGKSLLIELTDPSGRSWARLTGRAGLRAFSQGRRDLLQASGAGRVTPYGSLAAEAVAGAFVGAVRLAADRNVKYDPDWTGSPRTMPRIEEAYAAVHWRWGSLQAGQMARNWGPAGIPGVSISDAAYPRPDISLALGRSGLRYSAVATKLRSTTAPNGERTERYYVTHRLAARAGRNLTLGAWEVGVIAGPGDQLDRATRAVVPLLVYPALFASRAHRNEMVGADLSWRVSPRLRFEAELAIDDWNFDANNPYPQRWAGSLSGSGALGRTASWRASYTTASSLAFRTLNPEENIVDRGIGIGRLFPDNEVIDLSVGFPVRAHWLVTPKLALLRQGEGRIQSPFPAASEASSVPARFIGTVANSLWTGVSVAGYQGPIQVLGEGGLRYTTNADHMPGRNRTSFEGRITATYGVTLPKAHR